jgi:hypothetical protein
LSVSIASFTDGPAGVAGACGIAARPSGTSTAAICLPSFVKSTVVTSVASTGVFVTWRAAPVAASAIQMCVASSPWT